MSVRIRVLGCPSRPKLRFRDPSYLAVYDVDWDNGRGHVTTVSDPAKALTWPTARGAMGAYRTVSRVRPVRDDDEPNRPLTAFTILLEATDD